MKWLLALSVALLIGCKRPSGNETGSAVVLVPDPKDIACITRVEEGCVLCMSGRSAGELEETRQRLCDPHNPQNCIEFCTALEAPCATPWYKGATCLASTEDDFHRRLYWLEASQRLEAQLAGRVVDEQSKRLEGAHLEVLDAGTVIADTITAKEGSFRLSLRVGSYTLRLTKSGYATLIEPIRLGAEASPQGRIFRLEEEQRLSGRVIDTAGVPVGGATIVALRKAGDTLAASQAQSAVDGTYVLHGLEARRYVLRVSAFGFRPVEVPRAQAPSSRIVIKVAQTHVIEGTVIGADGTPQAQARIVVVSAGATADNAVHMWTAGADGHYAIDGFAPGSYLLWAHKGDRATYPPTRVTLDPAVAEPFELELRLGHQGSLVKGVVVDATGRPARGLRVELRPHWPLALPVPMGGETSDKGTFAIDGLLPGRYELAIRDGTLLVPIVAGPREVQVPIEEGEEMDLEDKIHIRRVD